MLHNIKNRYTGCTWACTLAGCRLARLLPVPLPLPLLLPVPSGRRRRRASLLRHPRSALPLLEAGALPAGHLGRRGVGVGEAAAPHRAVVQAAADLEVVPRQLTRAQRAGRRAAGGAVAAQPHHGNAAAQAPPHVAGHFVGRQAAAPRLGHARSNQAAGRVEFVRGQGVELRVSLQPAWAHPSHLTASMHPCLHLPQPPTLRPQPRPPSHTTHRRSAQQRWSLQA